MSGRSNVRVADMPMCNRSRLHITGTVIALTLAALPAGAQMPILAGKTVTLIIGLGAGSGYTAWGRVVARHLGKHLPGNPAVVAQNMPGAGSLNAANHIYAIAPKDGTVLGLIARDAPLASLAGVPG